MYLGEGRVWCISRRRIERHAGTFTRQSCLQVKIQRTPLPPPPTNTPAPTRHPFVEEDGKPIPAKMLARLRVP